MTRIGLYFDDDSEVRAMMSGRHAAPWTGLGSTAAGMRGRPDEEHLIFAASIGRTLVTSNIRDFTRLHWAWIASARHHSGIILVRQQRWSLGERMRRLGGIVEQLTAEEVADRLEWLSDWGEED